MAAKNTVGFILFLAFTWATEAVIDSSICPQTPGYVFIAHEQPCYFYTCYHGDLYSSNVYKCPTDPKYHRLLETSGLQNPCSDCPYAPTTVSDEPSTTPTVGSVPETTSTASSTGLTSPALPTDGGTSNVPKEIARVVSNAHVHGAVLAESDSSLRQCLHLCEGNSQCFGFDFDVGSATCWVHDETTACGEPEPKENCTHFRLYTGCDTQSSGPVLTTTPTSHVAMTTTPTHTTPSDTDTVDPETEKSPTLVTFLGQHVRGGSVVALATGRATPDMCVAICRLNTECAGVDYDGNTQSCWIHDRDSVCEPLVQKEGCVHFRLQDICDPMEMTTPAMTTSGLETTPGTGTPALGTAPPPELDDVPNGFVELAVGYHVPGGLLMYTAVAVRQCLDACMTSHHCLALDYDSVDGSCYFHFRDSYCSEPAELRGNYHLKRLPCITGVTNDAVTTHYHFHANGGAELCTGCTLGRCMEACYLEPTCTGLDFDVRNLACYLFTSADVCGPLIPKDYCLHVARTDCDLQTGNTFDISTLLVHPPPAGYPVGWGVYPGVSVAQGRRAGTPRDGAEGCVALCLQDAGCVSGDYDLSTGTCWLHTAPDGLCAPLQASGSVLHFKKHPCDTVFGTLQPFVRPLWTA